MNLCSVGLIFGKVLAFASICVLDMRPDLYSPRPRQERKQAGNDSAHAPAEAAGGTGAAAHDHQRRKPEGPGRPGRRRRRRLGRWVVGLSGPGSPLLSRAESPRQHTACPSAASPVRTSSLSTVPHWSSVLISDPWEILFTCQKDFLGWES